jgi:hypothetical protein
LLRAAELNLLFGLGFIGVAALLIVIVVTPWGIGLSPDSVIYIGGARSLSTGNGFSLPGESGTSAPIIHFPPLYSFLLAVLTFFGADPLRASRWLAAGLFAGNCILAVFLTLAVSQSTVVSLLVGLFVLTAFPIIQAHTMAWSEPLFLSLQLGGMLVLVSYLREPKRRYLIGASIILGLSALTRYAGVAMLVAAGGTVLLLSSRERRRRISEAIVMMALGLLPLLVWLARNAWLTDGLVNRELSIHPISLAQLSTAFQVMSSWLSFAWLTSFDVQSVVLIVLSLLAAACLAICPRRVEFVSGSRRDSCGYWCKFLVTLILSYVLTIFAVISFLDAQVPIDSRLLSPLYIPLVGLASVLGIQFWRKKRIAAVTRAMVALSLVLILIGHAMASLDWLQFSYREGLGYAGRDWRNSSTLAKLSTLRQTAPVYSNAPDALYVLRGIPAAMVPRKVDPQSAQPNSQYAGPAKPPCDRERRHARRFQSDYLALVSSHGRGNSGRHGCFSCCTRA